MLAKILFDPGEVIRELARDDSHTAALVQPYLFLLILLPPVFAGIIM